jgi:hypothetical protein
MSSRALALLFFCGCSAGGASTTSFSGEPLQTLTTTSGLEVKVWTSPQPPARGELAVKFEFPGLDGGVAASVTPWMPAMGHGASAISTGDALVAEGINIYMPGAWELRTQLSGAANDAFIVQLEIP